MSKREGPCYDGRRHRWQERDYFGQPRKWWCEKCGREATVNPR